VEELLAERGIESDHVTVYRTAARSTFSRNRRGIDGDDLDLGVADLQSRCIGSRARSRANRGVYLFRIRGSLRS